MGIKIKKIEAENLGPLSEFSEEFGDFNVIYGPNEKGKTFLTEFILRCIFSGTDRWNIREEGRGKVFLKGLEEGESISFTPSSDKKLDDFLRADKGLTPQLGKLLAVKGSDPRLDSKASGGAGKAVVKDILTEKGLLEKVKGNIKKTIRKADIEEDPININKMAEGKRLVELEKEKEKIENLIEEIESDYSPGYLEQLKAEKERIESRLEEQNKAKRHEAYKLNQKLKEKKNKFQRYDPEIINDLRRKIKDRKKLKNKIEKKEKDLSQKKKEVEKHQKLKSILDRYEDLRASTIDGPGKIWLIAAVLFFIAALAVNGLGWVIPGTVGFIIAFGFLGYYLYLCKRKIKNRKKEEELEKLEDEFEDITGEELKVATLEQKVEKYASASGSVEIIESDLEDLKEEFFEYSVEIESELKEITGDEISEENWENELSELKEKSEEIKNKKKGLEKRLVSLNVDEENYLEEFSIDYDKKEAEKLKEELSDKKEKIEEMKNRFSSLEKQLAQLIDNGSDYGFLELYHNLHEKKKKVEEDLEEVKAEIMAGKIVFDQLEELRKKEDERIKENFESSKIQDFVLEMTGGRYEEVKLKGDDLEVVGKLDNYELGELSTGAREQILLALRVGLSTKLLGRDSMFLLLDDAFQNTDWERRKVLVESLADLTRKGWQVIYLTMDDHIKGLFEETGQEKLDDKFKSINL